LQIFHDVWPEEADVCVESSFIASVNCFMARAAEANDIPTDIITSLRAVEHVVQVQILCGATQCAFVIRMRKKREESWVTKPHSVGDRTRILRRIHIAPGR
jgi:hypothetical protein